MITAVLAAIHARKWLVELIVLGVVVLGVYLFCQHLIGVGVERQKAADRAQYEADLAARVKQWQDAEVAGENRRQALQAQLSVTEDKIAKIHTPQHAVSHDTNSTDPCPALRLDPEWLRAFSAAGAAATVPYPGGGDGTVRADVPAQ